MNSPAVFKFKEVSGVNSSYDQKMKMLRVQAAEVGLNKMFKERHFSICAVDEACKALGAELSPEAYAILRPLHCVDWDQIPDSLKAEIPQLIKHSLQRSMVIRSMVQDMILGDYIEKDSNIEVLVEEAKMAPVKEPDDQTNPTKRSFLKWW